MKSTDVKVALKLKGRSISDKLGLWHGVATALPGVKELAAVVPPVAQVEILAVTLAEASAKVDETRKMLVNQLLVRDAAEVRFDTAFATLGTSAQSLAGGSAVLLTQGALPLASQNTAPVSLPKIDGVNVTQGDDKGHVDAVWHGVGRAKSYVVRYGLGGGPDKLTEMKVVTKSRISLYGLTSGQEGWLTVYAVGAEDGPASDPVRFMVP